MTAIQESINIENVVASTGIGQGLALESVAMDLTGSQFDPNQFPGLVYRMQDPKAPALIFRSGKIVCTGANSVDGVHEALSIVFDDLRELGIEVADDPEITVQNIVSSADLDQQLNLNAIAIGFGLEDVEYEPEQFPGLVYRLEEPNVVVLLFGSGKLVISSPTMGIPAFLKRAAQSGSEAMNTGIAFTNPTPASIAAFAYRSTASVDPTGR